jgi:hypothetical protein
MIHLATWGKAIVACFNVQLQQILAGTEENTAYIRQNRVRNPEKRHHLENLVAYGGKY